jgi:exodeoxyribonuclease VII large subunit
LVIRSLQEIEEQAEALRLRLARAMRYRLLMGRQSLTELAQHGAFGRMMDGINRRQQRLDDLRFRLERGERNALERQRRRLELASAAVRHYDMRRVLAGMRRELEVKVGGMLAAQRTLLLHHGARLNQVSGRLAALSPVAILERGYALVFDAAGNLLKDAAQVRPGEEITARLAKGTIAAQVKQ